MENEQTKKFDALFCSSLCTSLVVSIHLLKEIHGIENPNGHVPL